MKQLFIKRTESRFHKTKTSDPGEANLASASTQNSAVPPPLQLFLFFGLTSENQNLTGLDSPLSPPRTGWAQSRPPMKSSLGRQSGFGLGWGRTLPVIWGAAQAAGRKQGQERLRPDLSWIVHIRHGTARHMREHVVDLIAHIPNITFTLKNTKRLLVFGVWISVEISGN